MAIHGVRNSATQGAYPLTIKTGLIWWVDTGVIRTESHRDVVVGNLATQFLGRALRFDKDRTESREPVVAVNSRALAT